MAPPPPTAHETTVRRAALPEVMFASDISVVLAIEEAEADRAARSGAFGPQLLIRGRVAVLRDDFLKALALRASRRDAAAKEILPSLRPLREVTDGGD